MVAPKNSSAARNNPTKPKRRNDTPDNELIRRILRTRAGVQKLDLRAAVARNNFLALQVENGFTLKLASPATWEAFIEQPFWSSNPKQRPKSADQDHAVKFVLRIAFEEVTHGTKRANEVWHAVQYLIQSGRSMAEVIEQTKAGLDIKAIGRTVAKQNRAAATAATAKKIAITVLTPPGGPRAKTAAATVKTAAVEPHSTRKGASHASSMRHEHVESTETRLTFPQGFAGLEKLLKKGRSVMLEIRQLGGGGSDITVKLLSKKRKKTPKQPSSPTAN